MYVPHTMVQYLQLIDRPAHLAHVASVAVAVAAGNVLPADIPFSEALADAHDELQSVFDVHVTLLHWIVVHAGAQGDDLNTAQALKIANNLATLKDCNATSGLLLRLRYVKRSVLLTWRKQQMHTHIAHKRAAPPLLTSSPALP